MKNRCAIKININYKSSIKSDKSVRVEVQLKAWTCEFYPPPPLYGISSQKIL